jgi:hypothetical protein
MEARYGGVGGGAAWISRHEIGRDLQIAQGRDHLHP